MLILLLLLCFVLFFFQILTAICLVQIRSIDGIEYIHEDTIATILGSQNNPSWGLDRIDSRTGLDGVYNYNDNGRLFLINCITASFTSGTSSASKQFNVNKYVLL